MRCINFSIPKPLGDDFFFVQFPEVSVDRMNFDALKKHLVSSSKRWKRNPKSLWSPYWCCKTARKRGNVGERS